MGEGGEGKVVGVVVAAEFDGWDSGDDDEEFDDGVGVESGAGRDVVGGC